MLATVRDLYGITPVHELADMVTNLITSSRGPSRHHRTGGKRMPQCPTTEELYGGGLWLREQSAYPILIM